MRVLWPHNFDFSKLNSGIFMRNAAEGLKSLGVDIQMEYLGRLTSPWRIIKAREHLQKISKNFDLIHSQYGSACALTVSKIKGRPKILTLRGSDWNRKFTFNLGQNIHSMISSIFSRYAINSYDLVVNVSRRMESEVKERFPNIKTAVIPSPIDLQRFIPLNKLKARAELGFQNNTEKWILVTTAYTDNPLKRFKLAKKSVEIANKRMRNIRLRLASGIPHSNIPLFVGACDLVLCTSVSEGWPNSIKEALACNIPFISTDVSDLKEIVENEPSCRIVEPDPNEIALAICSVLQSNYEGDLRKYIYEMSIPSISLKMKKLYESVNPQS